MKKLKIKKAFYYDPKIKPSKGTDVKDKLSSSVRENKLFYQGRYNDIFPDEFKRINKKLYVVLTFGFKKFKKIYSENQIINLPNDLDFKKGIIFNLYNPLIVGIISSLIVALFVYFFLTKPTFFYQESNVVEQKHSGEGDNVAGDKIEYNSVGNVEGDYNFFESGGNEEVDKRSFFEGDIYTLNRQADHLKTSLDKQKYFEKYLGMKAEDSGYIMDIDSYGGEYVARIYKESYDVDEPYSHIHSSNISCYFEESWNKKLESLDIPFKLDFVGEIERVDDFFGVTLEKCEIK